jgi:hypothetical protein
VVVRIGVVGKNLIATIAVHALEVRARGSVRRRALDVGRVFPSLGELSVEHLRAGYGIALQLHTEQSFLFETTLASSIDGGVIATLSFNPVYLIHDRVRRR